jgi:GNAT superfamily N-acetyltransferase
MSASRTLPGMKIVAYDEVDPFDVLNLNILCFNFALTLKLVATIRRLDRRPFPFFALYAVDQGRLLGQVGVFKVPLMTAQGPLEAGAIWAMCTHPAHSRQGIGSALIQAAHQRMRSAGLSYSTLGTSRHWVAHPFYHRHGYLDLAHFASALAHHSALPEDAGFDFTVTKATQADLAPANRLFRQAAADKTGFSRRQDAFLEMMIEVGDILSLDQLRMIYRGRDLVGYAAVRESAALLDVNNFLLRDDIKVVDAAAALLRASTAPYVRVVTNNHAPYLAHLRSAGFRVTASTLDVTMIKPLHEAMTLDQLHRLFDVSSGRFMMSGFDVT